MFSFFFGCCFRAFVRLFVSGLFLSVSVPFTFRCYFFRTRSLVLVWFLWACYPDGSGRENYLVREWNLLLYAIKHLQGLNVLKRIGFFFNDKFSSPDVTKRFLFRGNHLVLVGFILYWTTERICFDLFLVFSVSVCPYGALVRHWFLFPKEKEKIILKCFSNQEEIERIYCDRYLILNSTFGSCSCKRLTCRITCQRVNPTASFSCLSVHIITWMQSQLS